MVNIKTYSENIFDSIKHIEEDTNIEYWYARELQEALEYSEWRNFEKVINKAKTACQNSNIPVNSQFVDVNKSLNTGLGEMLIKDYKLTRYACYLIVQNSDPRKKIISIGQTYFAIKTRQQELSENFDQLSEDEKRLSIRAELKHHNKSLAEAANLSGVETQKDYAIFQNNGYKGLYGGLGQKEIHQKKGLKKSQKILDHMGSTELAANLFRATQTDEKLRRDNIKNKSKANRTHFEVGAKVRKTIEELGGTMPEDLPTPKKSISKIEKEKNNRLAIKNKSKTEDDNR